jgi:hypothetical protein
MFQGVAAAPKILGMLATTTVIVALFTALPLTTPAGRQAAIDKQVAQMQSFGFPNTRSSRTCSARSTSF